MATTTRPALNIPVEESKAQRIQRQQARFRDRGGTFVPSGKNPLADILLARAVTGESPSKAKSLHSKTERVPPTVSPVPRPAAVSPGRNSSIASHPKGSGSRLERPFSENHKSVAESSKAADRVTESVPKKKASKRRKITHPEEADENENEESKPPRKRKARPKKSAQGNATTSKRKARTAAMPVIKEDIVESEDDQTLIEAPRKVDGRGKKRKPVVTEDAHDTGDDDHSSTRKQASRSQKVREKSSRSKRALENTSKESEDDELEVIRESRTKKRRPPDDDAREKKSEKVPRPTDSREADIEVKKPKKGKTAVRHQEDIAEQPVVKKPSKKRVTKVDNVVGGELDDDVPRPRKRKKAIPHQENQDDRPPKVEEVEPKLRSLPSSKLKENTTRAPSTDPKVKPTSRKPSKGPPPDLLERIRAIANNHRPVDDEPDPLDCLS
ncbi:hypothetical protein BKA82DRAFT_4147947 [Pisolithus tinctorius]|nr:hypothetical protein BKA82DRAFT_4147947 [Pisolithus tinctorius]